MWKNLSGMSKSKNELQEQLEIIRNSIGHFPDGASMEDILAHSNLKLNERTLQRRLSKLEKELKKIKVSGGSKATRYHLIVIETESTPSLLIPLSDSGQEILNFVSQALHQRKPVSYNRDFLDQYKPNITTYLSLADLKSLDRIGKTRISQEPAGTYAREILNRLLIDLSWNSSRLEGNTYSLLDTQQLIAFGKSAEGKSALDAQMILNHKEAIEFLVENAEEIGFNRYTIMNLHGLLSNNLLPDPSAVGRLRTIEVGISNSVFIPLGIPQLISEIFDQILEKATAIENPFERAFFVTVHLPYLQPFDDVNKRVSRLAANIPFLQGNLSLLSFVDVPSDLYTQGIKGVYELNRIELLRDVFVWAYQRSADRYAAIQHSIGEPDPFRMKYREEMKSLIFTVVTDAMDAPSALKKIQLEARLIPEEDCAKFIEAVETELLSLHEGNIARYKIRYSDFKKWKMAWNSDQ
jgi:Fic/DOC family